MTYFHRCLENQFLVDKEIKFLTMLKHSLYCGTVNFATRLQCTNKVRSNKANSRKYCCHDELLPNVRHVFTIHEV